MSWDTVTPYHRDFAEAYEAFGFAGIHAHALPHLPLKPGLMLDVGSERDTEWFAFQVLEDRHRSLEISTLSRTTPIFIVSGNFTSRMLSPRNCTGARKIS